MLVCLGATLTGILSQYLFVMVSTSWADVAAEVGRKVDVSRFGAKAIGGVGFLGAGTILITGRQKVQGLPRLPASGLQPVWDWRLVPDFMSVLLSHLS